MKAEIAHRITGEILFSLETNSFRLCVEAAVKSGVNLSRADLSRATLPWANLPRAILSRADLSLANLSWADLCGADLCGADLSGANLSWANLSRADLSGANLSWANLSAATLPWANLFGANLYGANLSRTILSRADLSQVNLSKANLSGAILSQTILSRLPYQKQTCPKSGSFEAWKKGADGHIIKLKVPWFVRRTACAQSRKCRAELAMVTAIYDKSGKAVDRCSGWHDKNFYYQVGKYAKPDDYDASWTTECSQGIHFFMTKQEAEEWS